MRGIVVAPTRASAQAGSVRIVALDDLPTRLRSGRVVDAQDGESDALTPAG